MTKKKPQKKLCYKCGNAVKTYTYGHYCSDCAKDVWDSGFESTSQHADEITAASDKEEEKIENCLLNPPIDYNTIRDLIEFRSGTFLCRNCSTNLLKWSHFPFPSQEFEPLRDALTKSCPKCGKIGLLKFESRDYSKKVKNSVYSQD